MKVERSALLNYSAAQIYSLIHGVEDYPSFLNWCHSAVLLEQTDTKQVAKLGIAYGRLKFSFVTENVLQADQGIKMKLVSGPFRHLHGAWDLQSLNDTACKVSLKMDFAFDNPITHTLFSRLFQSVVTAQVDAFQQRAQTIYGV